MALRLPDRVGESGCTYETTGPEVQLSGTAITAGRTFAEAISDGDLANGDDVYISIKDASDNWAVWLGVIDTSGAPDVIDRTTLISSSGTIADAASVAVYVVTPQSWLTTADRVIKNHIEGILPSWTDSNTIAWSAGKATVDGEFLDYAGGNTGNIGQSSDGLSATGLWHHWLYDNAGTPAIEMKQVAAGTPTWDTDLLYWKKGSDATRRLVGWHTCSQDTSRHVARFVARSTGNELEETWPIPAKPDTDSVDWALIRVVSSTGHTADSAWTAVGSMAALIPASCHSIAANGKIVAGASDSEAVLSLGPQDIEADYGAYASPGVVGPSALRGPAMVSSGEAVYFGTTWYPLKTAQTFYWALKRYSGTINVYVEILGGRMTR